MRFWFWNILRINKMFLIFLTLLGLLLRFLYSNQSFWLDEGASLMFAKMSLPQMFEAIKADFHPPLFYIALKLWLPIAGNSEWLIRLPFVIIGALTIPATFFLAQLIFGKKSLVPPVAALLLAINPLHIYYSQELRMYSLATLLVVLSWQALLKKRYIWLIVLNSLSLFTFYGVILNFISQIFYLTISKQWNKKYLYAFLTSAVVFLPWMPTFLIQLDNGSYLKNVLPGWQTLSGSLTMKSLLLIPIKFIMGRISLQPQKLYFVVGAIMTGIFSVMIFLSGKRKDTMPVLSAFFVPLFVGAMISLKTPMLGFWRFIYLLPFLVILVARGIENFHHKKIGQAIFVFICLSTIFFNYFFWKNNEFHREDWRSFSQVLVSKKSVLVFDFPAAFAPLNHYAPDSYFVPALDHSYKIKNDLEDRIKDGLLSHESILVMDYLADLTDSKREALKIVQGMQLKQVAIYNFNNLGHVYEFQKQ